MKTFKYFLIIILLGTNCTTLHSKCLKLIAEVNIDDMDWESANQIAVSLANKKSVGKFLAISPLNGINNILKEKSISPETNDIVISFESNAMTKYYFYSDFSKNINALLPYITTTGKPKYRGYDTVVYYTKGNKQTHEIDFTETKTHINSAIIINLQLNLSKISESEKNNFFRKRSLIFPIDISTNRWIYDIKLMKIYVLE